jgi:hypothetical protein
VSKIVTFWSHGLRALRVRDSWNSVRFFQMEEYGGGSEWYLCDSETYLAQVRVKRPGKTRIALLRTHIMMEWWGPVKSIRAESPGWTEATEDRWGQQRVFSY